MMIFASSKDRFLATLAHEMRNPLAPIGNAVQVIARRMPEDREIQWANGVVERQLKMMSRLLDDLLDLSRVVLNKLTLQRQLVDLVTVITAAVETSRPLITGAGHALTLDMPKEPIYVEGDPVRLAQVFANLLNNAAKYTLPGGHIALNARAAGPQVSISVSDDGMGIAEEFMPSLFNIFSQADSTGTLSQGGLGIGLSLDVVIDVVETSRFAVIIVGGTPRRPNPPQRPAEKLSRALVPIELSERQRVEPHPHAGGRKREVQLRCLDRQRLLHLPSLGDVQCGTGNSVDETVRVPCGFDPKVEDPWTRGKLGLNLSAHATARSQRFRFHLG